MHALIAQPRHFTSGLIVACIEPMFPSSDSPITGRASISKAFTSLVEDAGRTPSQRKGGPWIVGIPYSSFQLPTPLPRSGEHDVPERVFMLASSFNIVHDRVWLRPKLLTLFNEPNGLCLGARNDLCYRGPLMHAAYSRNITTEEELLQSARFCLEPPGDTPTRSHFYVAARYGCIPVIFGTIYRGGIRCCTDCAACLAFAHACIQSFKHS